MKYMRRTAGYTRDRLQNKCTNCKGVKNISYEGKLDIDSKLIANKINCFKNSGILNNVFRPQKKPLKKTSTKLHNTLALPVVLCGSETGTVKAGDGRRITAAGMKYVRITAGYIWDRLQNEWINCTVLKITQILDKLLEYKRSWIQHVNRMPRNKLPRVMRHYCPAGRGNQGRPLKGLADT